MKKYVLSIDQGTTSSRAILFDENGVNCGMAQREVACIFPHPGWVEVDPLNIWVSVCDVINEVCVRQNLHSKNVDSIAITNQRETTVVWEKATGTPVYNAIVWQSRQSAAICDALNSKKEYIHQRTGLIINPYFSASKIRFILDNIPDGQKRAENGELMFGTIDTWLMYKISEGSCHVTDVSNASRTLLFNIKDMFWDKNLCKLFNIPMCMLPKVLPSSGTFVSRENSCFKTPVTGVAGDQQAALFGQTCFNEGESKNTYGTGCFMLLNVGKNIPISKNGLLTTVAWQLGDQVTYALEGSVFMGGATVQWLRDQLKVIEDAPESEYRANQCKDSNGIYVVPAFVGLGTPYWDDDARGAIFGLTRGATKNQLVRATLEGIAYQCKDVFEVMKQETGLEIKTLRVDGGATANGYLMQFQSDILQADIKLPNCLETTALGAAYLAGLATGFYASQAAIKKCQSYKATFEPVMNEAEVEIRYKKWKKAVEATRVFK